MARLKRMYRLVATLALLHLVAAGVAIGWMGAHGMLDRERIRAAVEALRAGPATADASEADMDAAVAATGDELEVPEGDKAEIKRRTLDRLILEADHRLRLANRQMIEVTRRMEEFERREAERERLAAVQASQQNQEGFQKDLAILSQLKPKVALDNLLARPLDEAATILGKMNARKSKRIVEAAAKDPRKMTRMIEIQRQMRVSESAAPGDLPVQDTRP